MLASASPALATTDGGEGIYGSTNDQVIAFAMFIVMGFFVVVIVVFSLIMSWLERRKHARYDAAKHRASAAEWKCGW